MRPFKIERLQEARSTLLCANQEVQACADAQRHSTRTEQVARLPRDHLLLGHSDGNEGEARLRSGDEFRGFLSSLPVVPQAHWGRIMAKNDIWVVCLEPVDQRVSSANDADAIPRPEARSVEAVPLGAPAVREEKMRMHVDERTGTQDVLQCRARPLRHL